MGGRPPRGGDGSICWGGLPLPRRWGGISFPCVVVEREVLSLDHGGGYLSSVEPVESELEVGHTVSDGQTVAELITYDDGEYIDPLLMFGELQPSVLLPLDKGSFTVLMRRPVPRIVRSRPRSAPTPDALLRARRTPPDVRSVLP